MPDDALNGMSWETNPDELLKIGKEMYENDILPQIPHVKKGMMVVMDMASGDYEIDRRSADARTRLERRRPNAVMHTERVGYPTPAYAVSMRRPRENADD